RSTSKIFICGKSAANSTDKGAMPAARIMICAGCWACWHFSTNEIAHLRMKYLRPETHSVCIRCSSLLNKSNKRSASLKFKCRVYCCAGSVFHTEGDVQLRTKAEVAAIFRGSILKINKWVSKII